MAKSFLVTISLEAAVPTTSTELVWQFLSNEPTEVNEKCAQQIRLRQKSTVTRAAVFMSIHLQKKQHFTRYFVVIVWFIKVKGKKNFFSEKIVKGLITIQAVRNSTKITKEFATAKQLKQLEHDKGKGFLLLHIRVGFSFDCFLIKFLIFLSRLVNYLTSQRLLVEKRFLCFEKKVFSLHKCYADGFNDEWKASNRWQDGTVRASVVTEDFNCSRSCSHRL